MMSDVDFVSPAFEFCFQGCQIETIKFVSELFVKRPAYNNL
jgi:hypothetical protein